MKSFKNSIFSPLVFCLLGVFMFPIYLSAQETDIRIVITECTSPSEDEVYTIVEVPPTFPGGDLALYRYLMENIKLPSEKQSCEVNWRIFISFVVDKDGSITDVSVLRGYNKEYDSIAVKAIENMPKWSPGKLRDQPVKTRYVLPVRIQLEPLAEKANPVQKTTKVPNLISIPDLVEPDTNMEEVVERVLESESESESELEKVPKVKIYPNPVQEELFYSVSEPGLNVSFQIIDMYGQKCKWGYLNSTGSVDVSGLKPGFYVFQTIQNNKIGTSVKWIKL